MIRIKIPKVLCISLLLAFQSMTKCIEPTLSFSHERGFYYTSFELTLTASSSGCIIQYTLDGSDPGTSSNSQTLFSPATIQINPFISEGRAITPGIVVRACAICNGDTGKVETNTYIFPAEVKFQSNISPDLAPYWPVQENVLCTYPPNLIDWMRSDYQQIDLGIDPEVITKEEYYTHFEEALLDIPTLSLVTDPANLFDDSSGIYINSTWSGIDWERPGSIELISTADDGFQSNTGIRIRGGWSSSGTCPKHAFRLFFRNEYGNGKLNFPLFENEGVDKFDKIDLRCDQNNSWHVPGGNSNADFVHELFARDIQKDMLQPYTRSRYYHLFLNGMYWGLYMTQERAEASFAESYLGGNKEDYDVVKSSGPSTDYEPYTLEATDGDLNAARILWEIAKEGFSPENYNKVLGFNPDGTRNPGYKILLDEDNLIDYMIIIYFSANTDGPGELNGGIRINNFFGIYDKENPDGFKFFIHDAESAFKYYKDNITNSPTIAGEDFERFNPMWLHQKLMANTEYRQKFSDRAYRYLFNDGVLTVDKNIERFEYRANQIDQAIIGESARWGDVRTAIPCTKDDTWIPAIDSMLETYFPRRTDTVINQFKNKGWFNDLKPPEFDTNDFEIDELGTRIIKGETFNLINPNIRGEIYYTLNNKDPREKGGSIPVDAILYSGEIKAMKTIFIKARIKDGDSWSPLTEKVITLITGVNLKISEINFNPRQQISGNDTLQSQDLEFVELKNCGTDSTDISGFKFLRGLHYEFPLNSIIPPDSLVVIASDSIHFKQLYGFSPFGQFEGNLNNNGEEICLAMASGIELIRFIYNDNQVWYDATDGSGFSLVFSDYSNNQFEGIKEDWRVSTNRLGSPGKDDPEPGIDTLKITEVLANSEAPFTDAIELYNATVTDINIGNWYLSDDKDSPAKWRIPEGTIVPSKDYAVFYEGHFVNDTMQYGVDEFGSAFSISSAGESVYLFSADSNGNIKNFIYEYKVGATDSNTSYGIYVNTRGEVKQVLLDTLYLGRDNEKAKKSPVVFKTIMYHPAGKNYEYIVLKNRTDSVVNLFSESDSSVTWKVDGIQFVFPGKVTLYPGDSLYLAEKRIPTGIFKSIMKLHAEVQVFNFNGQLKNSSEILSIQKPVFVEKDTAIHYAYVNLESVEYNDEAPWPSKADGEGYALQRMDEEEFADDVSNWKVSYCAFPDANAGLNKRVKVNTKTSINGSGSQDPGGKPLSFKWDLLSKPAGSSTQLSNNSLTTLEITPDKEGNYLFSLEVENGETRSSPSFMSVYAYENKAPFALTDRYTYMTTVNKAAMLDGKRSFDPDYEELSYSWEIVTGPNGSSAAIQLNNAVIAEFIPDVAGRYSIILTVNDGELYSAPCNVIVRAASATGIIDNAFMDNTLIYPNPTSSIVNIDLYLVNSSALTISITDINGRVVFNRDYPDLIAGDQHLIIDMNDLNIREGMYLIRIQSEDKIVNEKIMYYN
jgi:hypothetical protein